jgi:hypothetical protein
MAMYLPKERERVFTDLTRGEESRVAKPLECLCATSKLTAARQRLAKD